MKDNFKKNQIFMNDFKEKFLSDNSSDKTELIQQLERSIANYYCGIKGDLGFSTFRTKIHDCRIDLMSAT